MPRKTLQHVFYWGWLRLILGVAQTSLSVVSLWLLVTVGLHPVTWASVGGATVATFLSRILYRGHHGHHAPLKSDQGAAAERHTHGGEE